jgi:hypothetical protein
MGYHNAFQIKAQKCKHYNIEISGWVISLMLVQRNYSKTLVGEK